MTLDPFAATTIAADYVAAALDAETGRLAVAALRAGWMTDDERARLAPLADAVEKMLGGPRQRPWDGVLATEGQLTRDRRLLVPGALTWETPVPLMNPHGKVIGRVDEIWRDGNLIRGRGVVDADAPSLAEYAAGISVTVDEYALDADRDTMELSKGRIGVVALTSDPAWTVTGFSDPLVSEPVQVALGELGEALMKDGTGKDAAIERAIALLRGDVTP